jgi:hypothetical protein
MAKGKGISSRAILLISAKVLVGKIVTTGHHAKAMSPDQPPEKKAIKNKRIKAWAWKDLHLRQVQLAFYKGAHR